MKTILHLDTSARPLYSSKENRNSVSRELAHNFRKLWKMKTSSTKVIYRDIGTNPPDFINEAWIAAVFVQKNKGQRSKMLCFPYQIN